MQRLRMVPVLRVRDGFHARVVAARLGAEGIVTQLRGGIDTPYPTGDVEVLVGEADLELARDLLLADEVESVFDDDGLEWSDDPEEATSSPRRLAPWAMALVLVSLALFAYAHSLGYQR